MEKVKNNRGYSFLVIAAVYLVAGFLGGFLYRLMPYPFWLSLLLADVAATVFTFAMSLLFHNASVYDPYWSVQPIVIILGFALSRGMTPVTIAPLIAVCLWGIRLTGNWAYTFHGLQYQDWRYTMLREKTGKLYPIINFLGIHMVPTLIVYGCALPVVFLFALPDKSAAITGGHLVLCGISFLISLLAVLLQAVSDLQMHRFRRRKKGGFIRDGLWKYARHPNYLGEILMWWGMGLYSVFALAGSQWYLLVGAAANTVLFLAVSIPMADNRQAKKPGYPSYKAQTRMLLPIKRNV